MARKSETKPEKGKKNADGTKKPGRIKQIIEVFKYTQEIDRSTLPLMLVALAVSTAVGVLLTTLIFSSRLVRHLHGARDRRADRDDDPRPARRSALRSAASRGRTGAALAAMQSIRRGWHVDDEPVQIDPRSQKMLFRASGRARHRGGGRGLVLRLDEDAREGASQHPPRAPARQRPGASARGGRWRGRDPAAQAPHPHAADEEAADQGRSRSGHQAAERAAPLAPPVHPPRAWTRCARDPTARRCAAAEPSTPSRGPLLPVQEGSSWSREWDGGSVQQASGPVVIVSSPKSELQVSGRSRPGARERRHRREGCGETLRRSRPRCPRRRRAGAVRRGSRSRPAAAAGSVRSAPQPARSSGSARVRA